MLPHLTVTSIVLRCSTSEQALYRLLRLFSKVRAHSFCCSSLPNRTRCAGLRFGSGGRPECCCIYSTVIFQRERHASGVSFSLGFGSQEPPPPFGFKCSGEVNEPRFSNCFIEKRGSSYVESLEARGFPLFVASDLFFKIL